MNLSPFRRAAPAAAGEARGEAAVARARRERLWLLLVFGAVNLYVLPSLSFGYMAVDDYELLNSSLFERQEGIFWRHLYARPVWVLTYPLVSLISDSAFAHRLTALLLLNVVVYFSYRLIRGNALWPLILLAIFFHPAFLYPISWISQRNDLLLILFVALTLVYVSQRRGLLFLAVSDLCKGPFVFHNLPYAYLAWRQRSSWGSGFAWTAAAGALLLMVGVLYGIYLNYYVLNVQADTVHGLYNLSDRGAAAWAFVLVSRGLKLVEGLFLAFVPFPAFYDTPFLPPALAVYVLAWGALAYAAWRPGLEIAERSIRLLVLTFFMAIPLAFGTGVRVISPALIFLFLGLLSMLRPSRLVAAALALVVAANLSGAALNYHFSNTGCYDLTIPDPAETCRFREAPIYAFNRDRQRLVDDFVLWVRSHILQ